MNLATQQLIFRAGKWPWKWFSIFRRAAELCKTEFEASALLRREDDERFNVLNGQHHVAVMECKELHKQKLEDAEKIQSLRDEILALKLDVQRSKVEIDGLHSQRLQGYEKEKILELQLKTMAEERVSLIKSYEQVKDGLLTYYEFMRRKNMTDYRGREIPKLPRFPHMPRAIHPDIAKAIQPDVARQ